MTLKRLRDEINKAIAEFPEVAELKVYSPHENPEDPDAFPLTHVILHDPDGDGFDYVTIEPD